MKKYLIFALFFFCNVSRSELPLPQAIYSIDDIVNEFREILSKKIEDLGKNYITKISENSVSFSSNTVLNAYGTPIEVGESISSMQFSNNKKENELFEKVIYRGFHGQITLVEDIITKGTDLKPISFSDFLRVKRTVDLLPNENSKVYRLSNENNEEIFKVIIEKTPNGKIAKFYLVEQNFLNLNYEFSDTSTRLIAKYNGYTGSYKRTYASWNFNVNYDPFSNSVLIKKDKNFELFFFNTYGVLFSQNDYLSRQEMYLSNGPLKRLRSIIDYHMHYFPETSSVKTSSTNEAFKEELRIMMNRLQNNIEINLVKKQLQEYIEAANAGTILDKRKKE